MAQNKSYQIRLRLRRSVHYRHGYFIQRQTAQHMVMAASATPSLAGKKATEIKNGRRASCQNSISLLRTCRPNALVALTSVLIWLGRRHRRSPYSTIQPSFNCSQSANTRVVRVSTAVKRQLPKNFVEKLAPVSVCLTSLPTVQSALVHQKHAQLVAVVQLLSIKLRAWSPAKATKTAVDARAPLNACQGTLFQRVNAACRTSTDWVHVTALNARKSSLARSAKHVRRWERTSLAQCAMALSILVFVSCTAGSTRFIAAHRTALGALVVSAKRGTPDHDVKTPLLSFTAVKEQMKFCYALHIIYCELEISLFCMQKQQCPTTCVARYKLPCLRG